MPATWSACSWETQMARSLAGSSPAATLRRRRLGAAIARLTGTDAPVKEIARACGWASENYFCKDFRRHVGVAPGRFRRERLAFAPGEETFG